MEVTLGKAFARSERLLSLKAGGWLSSCSKSRSFQRTMRTNLHTEGWVVSTNSYSSLVICKPHLSVEEVIMQQTGLVWACFYLALVVSGLKLDCSARKVVCTGPYRATLKLVQETHFLFWLLLRWATDCWMEGAEGELQIFTGMRWINQCLCKKLSQKWSHRPHCSQWMRWLSSCESLYRCPWSLLVTASLVLLAPLLRCVCFGVHSFPVEYGDLLTHQWWQMKSLLPPELGGSTFLWWSQRRGNNPVHFLVT